MTERMKVQNVTVNGEQVAIFVSPIGEFSAELPTGTIQANSLPALKNKIRDRLVKAAEAAGIEVTVYGLSSWRQDHETATFQDAVLVGRNAHTGRFLLRAAPKGRSVDMNYADELLRRLTAAERDQLAAALKAKRDAEAAYETLLKSFKVDGRGLLAKTFGASVED